MGGTIEITRRFPDGRIITVNYSDPIEKDIAIESEKKHQDDKYQKSMGHTSKAIREAFEDLCSTLEWG